MGEAYKRPLAVFFLQEVPQGFDAQREFRRFAGASPQAASPELILALRNASYQRSNAIELKELLNEPTETLPVQLLPGMDVEAGGERIRQALPIDWAEQVQWSSPHTALAAWRGVIESRSILVFQTNGVSLKEMRGSCIPDQPFPVILINTKDAPQGRIFTLIHEFAHILLHAAGHATSRMIGQRSPEEQPLEVAANAFAASALLPAKPFLELAQQYPGVALGDDNALRLLAQKVKVSPEAVLRRLVSLGESQKSIYREKREAWGNQLWYVRASSGPAAIPQHIKAIAREGRHYAQMVLTAYDSRLISGSAASDYLGTKPKHFAKIREELAFRGPGIGV